MPLAAMANRKSLSLLEILISLVIFSLVMAGLTGIFIAGKKHVLHSRSRIAAAAIGQLFLDPLKIYVRQDTWDTSTNYLVPGTYYCDGVAGHTQLPNCPILSDRTLDGIEYTATYTVSVFQGMRKVTTAIHWTEPAS